MEKEKMLILDESEVGFLGFCFIFTDQNASNFKEILSKAGKKKFKETGKKINTFLESLENN